MDLGKVLFFEASDDRVYAHTARRIYRVRGRLYEVENFVGGGFMRVSKSGLLNLRWVVTLSTVVGTTGVAEFAGSDKRLHVSRRYIKSLRGALRRRSKDEG